MTTIALALLWVLFPLMGIVGEIAGIFTRKQYLFASFVGALCGATLFVKIATERPDIITVAAAIFFCAQAFLAYHSWKQHDDDDDDPPKRWRPRKNSYKFKSFLPVLRPLGMPA